MENRKKYEEQSQKRQMMLEEYKNKKSQIKSNKVIGSKNYK